MSNIIDYILWRGDLTFTKSPLNEVDNLILSNISYIDFEGIIDYADNNKASIYDITDVLVREGRYDDRNTVDLMSSEVIKLIKKLAYCNRYKDLEIFGYVNEIDEEEEMQFSAITIDLGNKELYISYRGTDDTLVGWKEDFKMTFLDIVPSQKRAVEYLRDIAYKYPDYNIYLGGHSKGGNLAIYAAMNIEEPIENRIINIFNNDGPGFKESVLETDDYKRVEDRIISLVPESSVVGMLLEHDYNYMVVKSNEKGVLQHNGFSWEVCGTEFVKLDSVAKESKFLDTTVKRFLNRLPESKREEFTDVFFDLLGSNGNKTINDIKEDKIKSIIAMVKTYDKLDDELKDALLNTFALFFSEGIKNLQETKGISGWFEKIPSFLIKG